MSVVTNGWPGVLAAANALQLPPTTITLILIVNGLLLLAFTVLISYRQPYAMLIVFLIGLLFQEQVIRYLNFALSTPDYLIRSISLWKELVLAAMVIGMILRGLLRVRFTLRFHKLDWLLLAIFVVALIHVAFAPDRLAGLAATRNYFEPLLLFYVARSIPLEGESHKKAMWIALAFGVSISLLGTWQALGWDAATFQRWGFVHPDRWIPTLYVDDVLRFRPSSTLAGPNVLGAFNVLFMGLAVALTVFGRTARRWFAAAAIPLLLVGLIYTYSRSALLTFLFSAGVAVVAILVRRDTRSRVFGKLSNPWILSAVVLAITTLVLTLLVSGMAARITETLGSLTQQFHFVDKVEGLQVLLRSPAGIGMGQVGPRDGLFFPEVSPYTVESSLLQIAMDMGIYGLLMWLAFFIWLLVELWRGWSADNPPAPRFFATTIFCLWPGYLLAFIFLPLMQSLALMGWLWALSGLGITNSE